MLTTNYAAATIYKYTDNEGRIYFSDKPLRGNYRLLQRFGLTDKKKSRFKARIDLASTDENRQKYTPMIDSIAEISLIRPELLHAVIQAESSYDPNALSRAGAVGLMQLMPATAKNYGVENRNNPMQNLRGGASYLKDLLIRFKYDIRLALAAYNAGENAVIRAGNKIPDYRETQNYVKKVMRFYLENKSKKS